MPNDAPNLSSLHYLEPSEMHPHVEQAIAAEGDLAQDTWVALFRNRALKEIRKGSSLTIAAEASMLNRHLYSPTGKALRASDPAYHARLATIADMLTTAGQRTDSVFLEAVLSSHRKYALAILEILAEAGDDGVPRRELLAKFDVAESHMSHILGALEKAHLVDRLRRRGVKEVRVILGGAGRNLIDEKLLPTWFTRMEQLIRKAIHGEAPEPDEITESLRAANVPSRMMLSHIHDLVTVIADAKTPALK